MKLCRMSGLLAVCVLTLNGTAQAAPDDFHFSQGYEHRDQTKKFVTRKLPELVALMRVPEVFDPSVETLDADCTVYVYAERDGKRQGVNRVKGKYSAELLTLDPSLGTFEIAEVASGKFQTSSNGLDGLFFAIDQSALETNGTTAIFRVKSRFTNKKKANYVELGCRWGAFAE